MLRCSKVVRVQDELTLAAIAVAMSVESVVMGAGAEAACISLRPA